MFAGYAALNLCFQGAYFLHTVPAFESVGNVENEYMHRISLLHTVADDQVGPVQRKAIISTPNCAVRAQNCHLKTVTLVLVILICGLLILYVLL